MTYFNISKYLAGLLRGVFPSASIYDNIDPTREFTGALMVEIGETSEPETQTFLSGETVTTRRIYAAIRATTVEESAEASDVIREKIANALDDAPAGYIFAWSEESAGTSPDIRGIVCGESFYSFIEYSIIER